MLSSPASETGHEQLLNELTDHLTDQDVVEQNLTDQDVEQEQHDEQNHNAEQEQHEHEQEEQQQEQHEQNEQVKQEKHDVDIMLLTPKKFKYANTRGSLSALRFSYNIWRMLHINKSKRNLIGTNQ